MRFCDVSLFLKIIQMDRKEEEVKIGKRNIIRVYSVTDTVQLVHWKSYKRIEDRNTEMSMNKKIL